jgi:hypothetical protein
MVDRVEKKLKLRVEEHGSNQVSHTRARPLSASARIARRHATRTISDFAVQAARDFDPVLRQFDPTTTIFPLN